MGIFNQIQTNKPSYNTFDLAHEKKMSMKIGELTPSLLMEVVPGDKIKLQSSQLVRFAPMISPIMHRVNVYQHFFFVPNRLLYKDWEDFITGPTDKADVFPPQLPLLNINEQIDTGTLADYLGLPTTSSSDYGFTQVNAMPFFAYQKVWNDYYRDENLQTEWTMPTDLDLNYSDYYDTFKNLRKRAWTKDYFTASLPWTQKGPDSTIPLGGNAPIIEAKTGTSDKYNPIPAFFAPSGNPLNGQDIQTNTFGAISADTGTPVFLDLSNSHVADLSQGGATINDLRNAFRLQEWLEKNARGGNRYIETILMHFGVRSSDARLQRPEYIGGSINPVNISEVLQTSSTDQTSPLAEMGGHGVSAGNSDKLYYSAEEHGYIIGIISVTPKPSYQQGIPKHFTKLDTLDFYWPSFQHVGEQPVYNHELYLSADNKNQDIFGYVPRYAEYKYMPNTVHGEFKTTLNFWHMGRIFESRPNLNEDFITVDETEVERVFAVQGQEHLYTHIWHDIKATRPMAYFGNPQGV